MRVTDGVGEEMSHTLTRWGKGTHIDTHTLRAVTFLFPPARASVIPVPVSHGRLPHASLTALTGKPRPLLLLLAERLNA